MKKKDDLRKSVLVTVSSLYSYLTPKQKDEVLFALLISSL